MIGSLLTAFTTLPLFKNLALLFPFLYAFIRISYLSAIQLKDGGSSKENFKWDIFFLIAGTIITGVIG